MLKFSGEDGNTSKTVFTSILILILIAAVSFGVWYFFIRDDFDDSERLETHFKCRKCGHEFQILVVVDKDGNSKNKQDALCPECKTEGGGEIAIQCRKCGTRFVPKNQDNPVCSHCGANFLESKRSRDPEDQP